MSELSLMRVLPYGMLGVLLGIVYFSALGWNVRLYVDHGAGRGALLLHLLRLFAIAGALTLCARQGAFPLLSCLVGFQGARTVVIRQHGYALERES